MASAMPPPAVARLPLRAIGLISLLLVGVVGLVFHATLRHDFVNFDDDQYVYENAVVQGGLQPDGVKWAFTRRHSNNWHPLTWLSHMADCEMFGLNPAGHHAGNVALHAFNAVLLFLLMGKLTNDLWVGALAAAIFAVHPLRAESVAWIAERKDVLSGAFFLLTLLAYRHWVTRGKGFWRYALVLGLFTGGLLSKPMLVTLPLILLLLDFWPLQRLPDKLALAAVAPLLREKIPFFVLSAASCVATVIAQQEAVASFEGLPLALRLGNAAMSVLVYLRQLFFPVGLAPYYPFPLPASVSWGGLLSALILAAITFGVVRLRRARPYLLFGWLWYLVMLLPVIGIVQVGEQAHADRYTYLPQIGIVLALVLFARDVWVARPALRWGLGSLAVASLVDLALLTARQVSYWRDSRSLWERTLAVTQRNDLAHLNLGHVFIQAGRPAEALEQFHHALRLRPRLAEAHNNIGTVLMEQGRNAEALAAFAAALQAKPHYAEANNNYATLLALAGRPAEARDHFLRALQSRPDYPEVYYNLGNLHAAQGRPDEAIVNYERAVRLRPRYAKAYYGWGAALVLQRQPAAAIAKFETALQLEPGFAEVHYNLGLVLVAQQRETEAIAHFERAGAIQPQFADAHYRLALTLHAQGQPAAAVAQYAKAIAANPAHAASHNNLAWTLATGADATLRDGRRALAHAEQAAQLTGHTQPQMLDTLAAAYAECRDFPAAVATIQQALELPAVRGDATLRRSLQEHLQLYQRAQPLRETP